MLKFLNVLLIVSPLLWAQSFSKLTASSDTFLGFSNKDNTPRKIYIDESSSLAWQNTVKLRRYKNIARAKRYCRSLKLGGYTWNLPSLLQLQSLDITSSLAFTKDINYMAADGPVWDNALHFMYQSKNKTVSALRSDKTYLFVRCVHPLEN